MCGMLQFSIKQLIDTASQMTSVERMLQFTELDQEAASPDQMQPGESWPARGEIRFDQLYLRYGDEIEPVLKNISFTIEPCMKVISYRFCRCC